MREPKEVREYRHKFMTNTKKIKHPTLSVLYPNEIYEELNDNDIERWNYKKKINNELYYQIAWMYKESDNHAQIYVNINGKVIFNDCENGVDKIVKMCSFDELMEW